MSEKKFEAACPLSAEQLSALQRDGVFPGAQEPGGLSWPDVWKLLSWLTRRELERSVVGDGFFRVLRADATELVDWKRRAETARALALAYKRGDTVGDVQEVGTCDALDGGDGLLCQRSAVHRSSDGLFGWCAAHAPPETPRSPHAGAIEAYEAAWGETLAELG